MLIYWKEDIKWSKFTSDQNK